MRWLCKTECDSRQKIEKGRGGALLSGVLLLLMPKCALCWAAYMSFLSSLGIVIHYRPWFVPVMTLLFLLTLVKLLIASLRTRRFLAFILAAAAGVLILLFRATPGITVVKVGALLLMAVAVTMEYFIRLFVGRERSGHQVKVEPR